VRDHQLVARRDLRNLLRGSPHIVALVVGGHGLATSQQRIAA
jgi:hypothetical protein